MSRAMHAKLVYVYSKVVNTIAMQNAWLNHHIAFMPVGASKTVKTFRVPNL